MSNMTRTNFFLILLTGLVFISSNLYPVQVEITISKKIDRKIRITFLPFYNVSNNEAEVSTGDEIDSIVSFDIRNSGYFEQWPQTELPAKATSQSKDYKSLDYDFWLDYETEMVIKGAFQIQNDQITLELYCYDMATRSLFFSTAQSGKLSDLPYIVHTVTGKLIENVSGGRPSITTSKIAFIAQQGTEKNIFYIDYDGRNPIQVTNNNSLNLNPSWTRDGKGILFLSYFQTYPFVYLADLSARRLHPISQRPGLNAFPRMSPDGQKIAMTLSFNGNPEIYVTDASGNNPQRITYHEGVDTSPTWAPDNQRIAFVSDRSGTPQIYVINTTDQNAEPVRITYQGNYNTSPDWSPTPGSNILVYSSLYGGKNSEICLIDVETGNNRRVTTTLDSEDDPSWAPDGIHISYTLTQNYKSDIYFMDIRDCVSVRLTKGMGDCKSPSWGPEHIKE